MSLPDLIVTPRLLLRPWQIAEAPTLLAILQAERAHLVQDFPLTLASVADLPAAAAYIQQAAERRAAGIAFQYVLWDAAEPTRCLGQVNLKEINWHPTAVPKSELAYWLAEAAQGRGLMREAVAAVIRAAFAHLPLVKVFAMAKPQNARSRHLLEALGFHYVGRLRQESRTADPNGPIFDADYFDLLREEAM